jgi:type VII secretion ATPase EccA
MLVKFLAIEAAAHLGRGEAMFAELVGLEVEISNDTTRTKEFLWPELMLLKGLVLREMGKPEEANQVLSKLAAYRGGEPRYQRAAASESVRLQVVTNEIIAQRADPWDPDTQPSREEADAEQSREARDRLLEEANNLMAAQVGQPEVKKAIARLRATTQMDRAREEKGTKAAAGRAHHQIFTGAPGTGKTTVARVLGKYFSAYGIVKTDKVVEVGRKDLVGEHIGSTAPKTNKVIDEALDGVLFIDEFYALAQEGLSGGDAFGREAIDTLITRMEDDRDRLVVIVAGYAAPMQRAISTNEGLKTRFTRTIDFPSYNGKELMEIFEGMAVRGGVTTLLEETRQYLAERFEWMAATSWPAHDVWGAAKPGWTVADELGNGRGVRNLLARCEEERDNRLVESGAAEEMSLEEMTTVTLADARAAVTETLAEAAITAEGASS